jgi:tetratricopeptide (TPR) repeat protein
MILNLGTSLVSLTLVLSGLIVPALIITGSKALATAVTETINFGKTDRSIKGVTAVFAQQFIKGAIATGLYSLPLIGGYSASTILPGVAYNLLSAAVTSWKARGELTPWKWVNAILNTLLVTGPAAIAFTPKAKEAARIVSELSKAGPVTWKALKEEVGDDNELLRQAIIALSPANVDNILNVVNGTSSLNAGTALQTREAGLADKDIVELGANYEGMTLDNLAKIAAAANSLRATRDSKAYPTTGITMNELIAAAGENDIPIAVTDNEGKSIRDSRGNEVLTDEFVNLYLLADGDNARALIPSYVVGAEENRAAVANMLLRAHATSEDLRAINPALVTGLSIKDAVKLSDKAKENRPAAFANYIVEAARKNPDLKGAAELANLIVETIKLRGRALDIKDVVGIALRMAMPGVEATPQVVNNLTGARKAAFDKAFSAILTIMHYDSLKAMEIRGKYLDANEWVALASGLAKQGDYKSALDALREAHSLGVDAVDTAMMKESMVWYRKLVSQERASILSDARAWIDKAKDHASKGNEKASRAAVKEAVAIEASLGTHTIDIPAARSEIKGLIAERRARNITDARQWLGLARAELDKGNYENALFAVAQAVKTSRTKESLDKARVVKTGIAIEKLKDAEMYISIGGRDGYEAALSLFGEVNELVKQGVVLGRDNARLDAVRNALIDHFAASTESGADIKDVVQNLRIAAALNNNPDNAIGKEIAGELARALKIKAANRKEAKAAVREAEKIAKNELGATRQMDVEKLTDSISEKFGISIGEARQAAERVVMARGGILIDGMKVTVLIDGKPVIIEGKNGARLADEINKATGLTLSDAAYETAITILPGGKIEYSDETSVVVENGKIVSVTCDQKVYPGMNAIYIHSHPDSAEPTDKLTADQVFAQKAAVDQANLNNGLFEDAQSIFVIEANARIREISRTVLGSTVMIVSSVSTYRTNTFTFETLADGAIKETMASVENLSHLPEQIPAVPITTINPVMPQSLLAMNALSPGQYNKDKLEKFTGIMQALGAEGAGDVKTMFTALNKLRDAGPTNSVAVLAFDAQSVVKGGEIPDKSVRDTISEAQAKDNRVKVVLLVKSPAEKASLEGKVAGAEIVVMSGDGLLSKGIRDALGAKGYDVTDVAIFMEDTGKRNELADIAKDASAAKAGNETIPAYAVLNSEAAGKDALEKGPVNLQTLMASILFKSALVGIGYPENSKQMNELRGLGIFSFCKIFSDVGKAVKELLQSLQKTAISV